MEQPTPSKAAQVDRLCNSLQALLRCSYAGQIIRMRMLGPPTSDMWQPVPPTTSLGVTGLACPAAQGLQRLHTAAGTGGTLV